MKAPREKEVPGKKEIQVEGAYRGNQEMRLLGETEKRKPMN